MPLNGKLAELARHYIDEDDAKATGVTNVGKLMRIGRDLADAALAASSESGAGEPVAWRVRTFLAAGDGSGYGDWRFMTHDPRLSLGKYDECEPLVVPLSTRDAASESGAGETALQQYREHEGDSIADPLERLRFFCSLAMKGQDWLDVEPFFDAITTRDAASERAAPDAQAGTPKLCANAFSGNPGRCDHWCGEDRTCPDAPPNVAHITTSVVRAKACKDIATCPRQVCHDRRECWGSKPDPNLDPERIVVMVTEDMDTCYGERGSDYEFEELSQETVAAIQKYRAALASRSAEGVTEDVRRDAALEAFRLAVIARGRPVFGKPGTRDVDVAADQKLYDAAIAAGKGKA